MVGSEVEQVQSNNGNSIPSRRPADRMSARPQASTDLQHKNKDSRNVRLQRIWRFLKGRSKEEKANMQGSCHGESSRRPTIISRCKNGEGTWIHRNPYGPQVILLSGIVVKFGVGVTKHEAETQAYYNRHTDRSRLIVPQVFDYFTDPTRDSSVEYGFLVMEYIHGAVIKDLPLAERVQIAPRIATAMKYLQTIKPPLPARPGPIIEGGVPCGYFWSDSGPYRTFDSVKDLNTWLDGRIGNPRPEVSPELQLHEFGSRHMDIHPRNILRTSSGQICFVDWQFAGNYPRVFEVLHIKCCEADDPDFFNALLKALPEFEEELHTRKYQCLAQIMSNNILYGVVPSDLSPP
ncbi:hypothetical protein K431DRAFT_337844 [Polychaeton citri CBS 116435]|uniref:Aminoglycoside phosphotransferase domain-containing protein n=1 Tax=Polychaeton citri CBS 116435 TaxID=1314669 RepID=A0A9P4QB33_9PEZI|nr:hypothetical protein K431DRAFT_337844 [Polychaeton citri CBS 116435]